VPRFPCSLLLQLSPPQVGAAAALAHRSPLASESDRAPPFSLLNSARSGLLGSPLAPAFGAALSAHLAHLPLLHPPFLCWGSCVDLTLTLPPFLLCSRPTLERAMAATVLLTACKSALLWRARKRGCVMPHQGDAVRWWGCWVLGMGGIHSWRQLPAFFVPGTGQHAVVSRTRSSMAGAWQLASRREGRAEGRRSGAAWGCMQGGQAA
jgi:hypothetical protein